MKNMRLCTITAALLIGGGYMNAFNLVCSKDNTCLLYTSDAPTKA